jgi:hypothetical protein
MRLLGLETYWLKGRYFMCVRVCVCVIGILLNSNIVSWIRIFLPLDDVFFFTLKKSLVLMILALFAVAPIICSCLLSLAYSLYLFMAYEEAGVHHAQEFENRFWTIFAVLTATALFFAKDSPLAFGLWWSNTAGFVGVILAGYAMHVWDRYLHRIAISNSCQQHGLLRRLRSSSSSHNGGSGGNGGDGNSLQQQQQPSLQHGALSQSLLHLRDLGIPVESQLAKINECLTEIDQLLIPSTINNFINKRYVQTKEREIISIFEECDARALNYLIGHVKLGLLFYKIKDHLTYHGKHRTELIHLLAVERLSILTVMSRVILLHSLQLLKLRANPKAEYWVHHILIHTHQDELSELKTLTDAKGDYFCMNKLIYDDIKSESVRQDILHHIRREAAVQQTHWQMGTATRRTKLHQQTWRKVLSDVDDTLYCSGGMYPAGIDKRYPKKTVYPGCLAFYRELDLGTAGPEEWQENRVGNLVFLSARPHVYKDISEKHNFAKFEKLRSTDGRQGMHTTPSLLAGDLASGSQYFVTNDFEPLARKKFDNFRQYVNLYPEYQHVFVCDNGQGDVRAGEMMFDSFPYEFEALYVHVVQEIHKTHGFNPKRWKGKEFSPIFFRTYPEAALHAASRHPPLIRIAGLKRICQDTVNDFAQIKGWPSELAKADRRQELNQAVWRANQYLEWNMETCVHLIRAEQLWDTGARVRTPYGVGVILGFDPIFDLYEVILDWRPLDVQLKEHEERTKKGSLRSARQPPTPQRSAFTLATVHEIDEHDEETASSQVTLPPRLRKDRGPQEITTQQGGEPSAERPERSAFSQQSMSMAEPESPSGGSSVVSDVSDIGSNELEAPPTGDQGMVCMKRSGVTARLSGRCLSKYTPPLLPMLPVLGEKRTASSSSSIFTFFQSPETVPKQRLPIYKEGDECSSPYGIVRVVEYRAANGIVVVDMLGWNGRAYLRPDILIPVPQNILRALLRKLGTDVSQKPLDFPHAQGTVISTPFGAGFVKTPLPAPPKGRKEIIPAKGRKTGIAAVKLRSRPQTMGICIDSWTLADGSHPMLYCTEETARGWKDRKETDTVSIFTALGSIVTSSRSLLEPFLQHQHKHVVNELPKKFSKYYTDAAAVSTPFGNGRIVSFRESDGFYEVALTQWKLASGKHPRAFVRGVDLRRCLTFGCQEGYPVLTSLGQSGILASVEPTTGVHIVTIPSAGMVCYLQPECVLRPLKAAATEDVFTLFGVGTVEGYDMKRDIYTITLNWNAKLYAKPDTFDRVGEGIQERDGPFGVNWLLRLLFFKPSLTVEANPPRSRSNSLSGMSQKSKN